MVSRIFSHWVTKLAGFSQMFPSLGGQFPPSPIVLDDQAAAKQKWLDNLTYRPRRQAKHRGDHVQTVCSIGQGAEELLLNRTEADLVQTFKITRPKEVSITDRLFTFGTANSATRLKESQSEPRRATER